MKSRRHHNKTYAFEKQVKATQFRIPARAFDIGVAYADGVSLLYSSRKTKGQYTFRRGVYRFTRSDADRGLTVWYLSRLSPKPLTAEENPVAIFTCVGPLFTPSESAFKPIGTTRRTEFPR